jgi:hypothetical protein
MAIRLWRPLAARQLGKPTRALLNHDVSETLEKKLRSWIEDGLYAADQERIALRLNIPEALDDPVYLYDESFIDADDLYAVIDAILDLQPSGAGHFILRRRELQELLDDSLSAYTLSPDGRSLVNRADSAATAALNDSIATARARTDAGSASDHLATAWAFAYAIRPEPEKSYSESIKAVEAAAHAIIEPTNSKATLGTMIRHMRANPANFTMKLPDPGKPITPVLEMTAALWGGQTSRHGGQQPTRIETLEEARAAVHLAVVLVQWFSAGVVQRVT